MSDNSTGSSGSSSNSWTLLSPEEAAIDTAGPVDDGTESIGDAPSLSEDVAGSSLEVKPSESEAPLETILSEEGQQVCQETSPEFYEESIASGIGSDEADPEICAPVIHHTITSSPPDIDLLGAVPFSLATNSSMFMSEEPALEQETFPLVRPMFESIVCEPVAEVSPAPEPIVEVPPEPIAGVSIAPEPIVEVSLAPEQMAEVPPAPEPIAEVSPASEPMTEVSPAAEPMTEASPASEPMTEVSPAFEPKTEASPASEPMTEVSPASEPMTEVSPASEAMTEVSPVSEPMTGLSPASEPVTEVSPASEPTELSFSLETPDSPLLNVTADISPISISCTSAVPGLDVHAETSPAPQGSSLLSETYSSCVSEVPLVEDLYPETVATSVLEEEDTAIQREEPELPDKSTDVVREPETLCAEEGDGLRLRHVQHADMQRQSSDEEDEEEEDFKLPERKEEKSGFSLNHLIIGALALLCLGSLFFTDFDGSELSDQELLEKLSQENKQISILEAQIQSQKEELDKALKMAADKGITDIENAQMKEELSALPALKEELEALKVRISELTMLTAEDPSEMSQSSVWSSSGVPKDSQASTGGPDRWKDKQQEFKRQKTLLEESGKRLEGIKKNSWHKKGLRESLVEMQQRLSEQVDHMGKRDEWKRKHKEHKEGTKEWGEKKRNQWKTEEPEKRKEWKTEEPEKRKEWKTEEPEKRKEWNTEEPEKKKKWKTEESEKRKEWKTEEPEKRKVWNTEEPEKKKEWKTEEPEKKKDKERLCKDKHESDSKHKEHFKKYREEWDHKKGERKLEREKRKQERPWQTKSDHHNLHNHHQNKQHHSEHESADFWKHQEEKLQRNQNPPERCRGVADCADAEGLIPVKLSEFQALLEIYLSKLEGVAEEDLKALRRLTARFFNDGIFSHDSMLFSEFAEDVADILEDLANVLMDTRLGDVDDDALEEEMEQFEKEALWKFAAPSA